MPVWRLQVSWGADTAFPRDRMVITPHFNDAGALTDPDGLCEDLADALATWGGSPTREILVRAYDAQGTPPVFPQGEAIRNTDSFPPGSAPREIAVCLSFYSERNLPRQRGRLYIPVNVMGQSVSNIRPSTAAQTKVADLVPIFTGLGGPDVDWCVYSRVDDEARPVTNWFVDDEWDVQRSRGLRSSNRQTGTTSEA